MVLLRFQLLGITIQHEKPQLEVQKTELLRKEEELKVQLADLEESLLEVRKNNYKKYKNQRPIVCLQTCAKSLAMNSVFSDVL